MKLKEINSKEILFGINVGVTINGKEYIFSPISFFRKFRDNFNFVVKVKY